MYFPQMTNQEAVLFFTFEHLGAKPASTDAVPRTVFHTAFDPQDETSVNADSLPPRVSIETRCLVVFAAS
jgi:hypothetical protein